MMKACLLKIIEVLQRQYERYFKTNITDVLREETESSRLLNIDAESIMGMFSAAKEHAPNATMDFLSSRIKACKNNAVEYLDNLPKEKRNKVIQVATGLARKQRLAKRKKDLLKSRQKLLND